MVVKLFIRTYSVWVSRWYTFWFFYYKMWCTSRVCVRSFIVYNLYKWYCKYIVSTVLCFIGGWHQLICSHKNLDTLINILNKELDKISNWLKVNKLSLNIKKTHFILFHNKQKLINTKINIKIDNSEIEHVFSTKFLGVIINENLTSSDHIYVLLNKTSKNLGVICKLSKSLPLDIVHTLYNTLIDPYFQYCNIAWATLKTSSVDKLFHMQKKAIRIITVLLVINGIHILTIYLKTVIF